MEFVVSLIVAAMSIGLYALSIWQVLRPKESLSVATDVTVPLLFSDSEDMYVSNGSSNMGSWRGLFPVVLSVVFGFSVVSFGSAAVGDFNVGHGLESLGYLGGNWFEVCALALVVAVTWASILKPNTSVGQSESLSERNLFYIVALSTATTCLTLALVTADKVEAAKVTVTWMIAQWLKLPFLLLALVLCAWEKYSNVNRPRNYS